MKGFKAHMALYVSATALLAGMAQAQDRVQPAPADAAPAGTPPAAGSPADGGGNNPNQVDVGGSAVANTPSDATSLKGGGDAKDIVVTGFRASLASAINAKRLESGMVDVIKSEDIAKFPDNNLAESIQRIPGVSIARDAGEGRNITVRGLGSQFTRIRINGMEAQSTTSGTDSSGGANRGRGFDFNVFASELFNSITVRKTQSAEVDEGSLGATVDLQTAHPFDFNKTTFAASAQGNYNDLRRAVDPRLAALFATKLFGGTVGILGSVAYQKTRKYEDGFGTVGYDYAGTNGGFCSPVGYATTNPAISAATGTTATACSTGVPRPANTAENNAAYATVSANGGNNVHLPRIPRYGRLIHNQDRLGMTGSIQWKPSSHTLITFDALYSDFKATREEIFLDGGFSFSRALSNNGKPQTAVRQIQVAPSGDVTYGLFDNVDIRSEDRFVKLRTKFQQYTVNARQDITSWWTITALAGYSKSAFSSPIDTTLTIDRANTQGFSYDFRNDDRHPIINYGFNAADPNNFAFTNGTSEIRLNQIYVTNTFKTANIQNNFRILDGLSVKLGGEYKRFSFDANQLGRTASSLIVPALPAGTTVADITKTISGFGRGFDVPSPTPTSWVVPDVNKYASVFGIFSNQGTFLQQGVENTTARGGIRGVIEKDKSGYGQIDFNLDQLIGIPLRGDIGVRYVETNQSARGYQLAGSTPVLVNVDRTYHNWLPSLNLTYTLKRNLLLRFGASQVMTRPDLGSLTPGGSITVTGNRSITSGNPLLDPIKAKTIDVAVEWYPSRDSVFSAAFFYKKISTYIQTVSNSVPFSATGLSTDLLANSTTAPSDLFNVSQPVNTPGGPLKGFELNGQVALPFHFLPEWLDHFGVLANYTHVTSNINYYLTPGSQTTTEATLLNLSKNAYNATAYFDDGKFSIRASLAFRSGFLNQIPGTSTGNNVNGQSKLTTLDANASYQLTKWLKLTVQGINLTDAPLDQFTDSTRNSPYVNTHTGRQFYFGAGVKF